jgi:hypothetical protein
MRAYNLIPKEVEMSFGKLSTLVLGEAGRGRKMTYVPCERRFEDGAPVDLSTTQAGRPKIVAGTDCTGGWLARISTEGPYIRGAYGHIRALDTELVRVVADGYGAFGDAGRCGQWYDYLLQLQPGAVLRVKPSRGDAYFLHAAADRIVRLEREEALVYDGADIPIPGEDADIRTWIDEHWLPIQ